MKWWLFFPILVFAFIQTTVYNFNFLLLVVLILALIGSEWEGLLFAFVGGVLLDLLAGTWLGVSSLALLMPVFLALVYKRKFQAKNFIYWIVLFFICSLIFRLVRNEGWRLTEAFLMSLLSLPSFFISRRLEILGEEEGIKLKISNS